MARMKFSVFLDESVRITLQQLAINHPHRDARCRAAGILALAEGLSPTAAAAQIGVSKQSLYNWHRAWDEIGLFGLIIGHKGGRPFALSREWVDAACKIATAESLSLSGLAKRLEVEMNATLPCSLETLGNTLKASGFCYKRARYSLKKT
jgi:transposase